MRPWFNLALALVITVTSLTVAANPNVTLTIRPSLSGSNLGGPFLRGTEGVISLYFENCSGCDFINQSNAYVRLPPGLVFDRSVGYNATYMTCTPGPVEPSGQTVVCSGAHMSGSPAAVTRTSALDVWVDVAPDAPLGAAPIHAGFDDAVSPPTGTLAACMANPAPANCDVWNATIAVPPLPDIEILGVAHAPGVFAVGVVDPRLTVTFRNRGTAATLSTHIDLSLPPGITLGPGSGATPLGMSCSVLATTASGQTLRCSGGALLPGDAGNPRIVSLVVRFVLDAALDTPGPVDVLVGADPGGAIDAATLRDCSADPAPDHCALHPIPTGKFCAGGIVPEGIYCDGFERVD